MPSTLYFNCRLYRPLAGDTPLENSWILEQDGRIARLGSGKAPKAETSIDLDGNRVLPGLINAHTHLYSALAPRMPWPKRPVDFHELLKKVWWRLDRALDEKAVRISVRLGLHEAIRHGCTTIVDHHSSPGIEEGVLAVIAEEAEKAGVKIILSCEASDRNGENSLEDAMDENLRTLQKFADHETVRGVYGLHASFTLSDESIDQILEILPFETPFHLHCAEAELDNIDAREAGYESVVDRLMSLGLLRPGCILAHGIHLQPGDMELLRDLGCFVVHCPQSNAHNRVGNAKVGDMLAAGIKVGLGTDGFLSGMLTEAQFARDTGVALGTLQPKRVGELLFQNNAALVSTIFGRPIGYLEEGEDADFLVQENGAGVLDSKASILRVVSRGKTIYEDGQVAGFSREKLQADADREAKRIWRRIEEL